MGLWVAAVSQTQSITDVFQVNHISMLKTSISYVLFCSLKIYAFLFHSLVNLLPLLLSFSFVALLQAA